MSFIRFSGLNTNQTDLEPVRTGPEPVQYRSRCFLISYKTGFDIFGIFSHSDNGPDHLWYLLGLQAAIYRSKTGPEPVQMLSHQSQTWFWDLWYIFFGSYYEREHVTRIVRTSLELARKHLDRFLTGLGQFRTGLERFWTGLIGAWTSTENLEHTMNKNMY